MALFNRFYWIVAGIIGLLVSLRCILVPFAHDEVATFLFFIQSENFLPFHAHADANNHFFTSLTSWCTYKLFGSEVWSLRIPCILAFLLLAYAVFRCTEFFKHVVVKVLFSSCFLLCYNFLGYYALCRGYGFSMSFLLLSAYYLFNVFKSEGNRQVYKFLLFSQLALSANLTLVVVLLLMDAVLLLRLIYQRRILHAGILISLVLNFGLIWYWVKYAFFLKGAGALYYGEGENYWKVTFQSLIETLFGHSLAMIILMPSLFVLLIAGGIFVFVKWKEHKPVFFLLSLAMLLSLITGFFLLKLLTGTNYPEDRTGLFFYLFFVLTLCFGLGHLRGKWQPLLLVVPLALFAQFLLSYNTEAHPWRFFETVPGRFYEKLVKEQKFSQRPVTIAGHRVRELFFGFLNYNSPVKLNHITAPEALHMNCDFALAYAQDKPWYMKFYEEIDAEPYFNFRLLKRINPIERRLVHSVDSSILFSGDNEYYNVFEKINGHFASSSPLQADFTFSVKDAPVPLNAWLVLQIDATEGDGENTFVRIPLNLIRKDWRGSPKQTFSIVTGNIPKKYKRLVAYLWNIEKRALHVEMERFELYELMGEGIHVQSRASI